MAQVRLRSRSQGNGAEERSDLRKRSGGSSCGWGLRGGWEGRWYLKEAGMRYRMQVSAVERARKGKVIQKLAVELSVTLTQEPDMRARRKEENHANQHRLQLNFTRAAEKEITQAIFNT